MDIKVYSEVAAFPCISAHKVCVLSVQMNVSPCLLSFLPATAKMKGISKSVASICEKE